MSEANKQIVLFGCWNKDFCNPENPGDSNAFGKVVAGIKGDKTLNPEFLVVLGDNYYPSKHKDEITGKKTKTFNYQALRSGFECLSTIERPVHLLLGNHDLEETTKFLGLPRLTKDKRCVIIDSQKALVETMKKRDGSKLIDLTTTSKLWGSTLMVFINSMFYTKDAADFVTCYLKHYENKQMNVGDIIEAEKNVVLSSINRILALGLPIKNVIVCGHDPLVSNKMKKGKPIDIKLNQYGSQLFTDIYKMLPPDRLLPPANIYYCCADVHNYQTTPVQIALDKSGKTLNINQIVIGTGGAHLDDCQPPENRSGECIKQHGYVVCTQDFLGGLTFEFKPVDSLETKGAPRPGGMRKRNRKRKTNKNHTKKRKSYKKMRNISKKKSITKKYKKA